MGYGTRSGTILTFTPDNDENTLYIEAHYSSISLVEIADKAREHFGADLSLSEINIEAEHIHTDCLSYDRYDATDYTNYLKITRA